MKEKKKVTKETKRKKSSIQESCDSNQEQDTFLNLNETFSTLADRELNRGLAQAVLDQFGWEHPTIVQSKVIPVVLKGKDVLLRAQTGSGKTFAYVVPICHLLLTASQYENNKNTLPLKCIIIVPTRELCRQISHLVSKLSSVCCSHISIRDTAENLASLVQNYLPTCLVTTPKAFRSFMHSKCTRFNIGLNDITSTIQFVVLDEIDAITELGMKEDITYIFQNIFSTSRRQTIMCSATFNAETDYLKTIALHKPEILDFSVTQQKTNSKNETNLIPKKLTQYYFQSTANDKYLVIYGLLKLSLLPYKCLIFTESTERAYRLMYFFERFAIKTVVVSPEMTFASRETFIQSFNQGILNVLIATNEVSNFEKTNFKEKSNSNELNQKRKRKSDTEFGIQRGIDFRGVSCVVNFDVPLTAKTYTHGIGRTARANNAGVALLLSSTDYSNEKILLTQYLESFSLKPLDLNLKDLECFRYRVEDVLQTLTPKIVTKLRIRDIQFQLMKSDKLKEHFETASQTERVDSFINAFKTLHRPLAIDRNNLASIPSYFQTSLVSQSLLMPTQKSVELLAQKEGKIPVKKTIMNLHPLLRKKQRRRAMMSISKKLAREPDHQLTAIEKLPCISNSKIRKFKKRKFLEKKKKKGLRFQRTMKTKKKTKS